jgi:ATP-dependent 26S proteasome regulatory subunit
LLFELLNEMDGLGEDSNVTFLLTSNRPDLLEPALAARPGRVDLAVEIGLPDSDCRRRLFELYRGNLALQGVDVDSAVTRTEGVTASFIKELMRQSALNAAERPESAADAGLGISDDDVQSALNNLLDSRSALTRTLLGSLSRKAPPDASTWLRAGAFTDDDQED